MYCKVIFHNLFNNNIINRNKYYILIEFSIFIINEICYFNEIYYFNEICFIVTLTYYFFDANSKITNANVSNIQLKLRKNCSTFSFNKRWLYCETNTICENTQIYFEKTTLWFKNFVEHVYETTNNRFHYKFKTYTTNVVYLNQRKISSFRF